MTAMSERVEEIRQIVEAVMTEHTVCSEHLVALLMEHEQDALAQAERERDNEKIACDAFQRLASERGAEVERLQIENDAARKSIGEAWDTAVADGAKIHSLEAEVERLAEKMRDQERENAALACVNVMLREMANLSGIGRVAKKMATDTADKARAALEGRG